MTKRKILLASVIYILLLIFFCISIESGQIKLAVLILLMNASLTIGLYYKKI